MRKTLRRLKKKLKYLTLSSKEKRHNLVGPPKLWKMKQEFQIEFLSGHGMKPSDKLLDIGCGTLRGGVVLIKYLEPGKYFGIDVRKEALDEGRKELHEEGLDEKEANLIHFEDFDNLMIPTKFNKVWAFSVLIHMADEISDKCLKFVSKHLEDDGVFYANVNIHEMKRDTEWQGFPVVHRTVDFYEDMAASYGMTMEEVGVLKDLGHISGSESQDAQIMYAFRLKK
jgi:cyclopropane fatty-acyl-phospholipid synthase-like methyltransferase